MQSAQWWAQGDLLDACNCELLCPCHVSFRQAATYDTCEAFWGINIQRGAWGQVSLDGLKVAVIALCPHAVMFDGDWDALLFIDDTATAPQEEALIAIFSGEAGGPWSRLAPFFVDGKFRAMARATIEFSKGEHSRSIKVSDVASLEIEAIRGADGDGVAKLVNLRNVIHGKEHILAHSTHSVEVQGIRWENVGKNGLYSDFSWSGP